LDLISQGKTDLKCNTSVLSNIQDGVHFNR